MIQHVCRYALYVCMYLCPRPGRRWNGRTNEVLTTVRYGMVRYYLWAEKGCHVCIRACTCAGLGGAVLGGAVLCCAGRCCAVRCCAVLASLSESNEKKKMKVKDKKRKKEKNMLHAVARLGELFGQGREYAEANCSVVCSDFTLVTHFI